MWRAHGRARIGPVDDEIMSLRFARDCLADRGIEEIVPLRGAQRGAQIGCVFVTQAHVKRAGASHPHAVAALAKIVS